jgi:ribosome-associated protein
MSAAAEVVPIRDAAIRVGQLLKLAGIVDDGGQAKAMIAEGGVLIDGVAAVGRGAQVRPGQTVTVRGRSVRVVSGD